VRASNSPGGGLLVEILLPISAAEAVRDDKRAIV
jgi:hypothetical protein